MNDTFTELRIACVPIGRACVLVGRARSTHYRHVLGPVHGPRRARIVPDNGQASTSREPASVLALINADGYADLSIGQIWAMELDEGRYGCSVSSMYQIARAAGQIRRGTCCCAWGRLHRCHPCRWRNQCVGGPN